jgi:hypothetical protein
MYLLDEEGWWHSSSDAKRPILGASGRATLAKGDKRRSNREIKKPKQDKPKPAATSTRVPGLSKSSATQKRPKPA